MLLARSQRRSVSPTTVYALLFVLQFLAQRGLASSSHVGPAKELELLGPVTPTSGRARSRWRRCRAWVLYNLSPCDKSIWACLRLPMWWVLNGIGLIPTLNHAWWLLLFLFKDKSDEYQLCDFIIGSEAARFFRWVTWSEDRMCFCGRSNVHVCSVGCWSLVMGALKYYLCTTLFDLYPCPLWGPKLSVIDATAFVIQTLLVWSAYWMVRVTCVLLYGDCCYSFIDCMFAAAAVLKETGRPKPCRQAEASQAIQHRSHSYRFRRTNTMASIPSLTPHSEREREAPCAFLERMASTCSPVSSRCCKPAHNSSSARSNGTTGSASPTASCR